jgi:rod shape-determining protein MreD
MIKRLLGYAGLGFAAILLQMFLDDYAAIGSVAPQLVLLFVVYVALREGQLFGICNGFIAGFFHDLLVTHFIGLTSFVAIIAAFVAGFFYKESDVELAAKNFSFVWISTVSLFISGLAALPIIGSGELNYFYVFLKFTLGSTVYSSVFAMMIVFLNGRRFRYV